MKAVMMAIRPKYCADILNLIKSIEIRTSCPHFDPHKTVSPPFKVYIYCTENGGALWKNDTHANVHRYVFESSKRFLNEELLLNGKVIAEFTCEKIRQYIRIGYTGCRETKYNISADDLNAACLSYEEFDRYAAGKVANGWFIKDLKIYDKPLEISDFKQCHKCEYVSGCHDLEYSCNRSHNLRRPPQSWCYVEDIG